MSLETDGVAAVVALHADLEAWIGRGSPEARRRFEGALTEGFTMITPAGVHCDRATVVEAVSAMGGTGGDGFAIRIEGARAQACDGGLAAVVYREVQSGGSRRASARWSTALLIRGPDGAMRWCHVHECWADGGAAPSSAAL